MTTIAGSADQLYYRHSGQFSALGVTVAMIGSLAAAIALAFVYAYVDLYNPLMIVSFLATAGFAAGIGFVTGWLMRWGQVRNTALTNSTAVVVALVGLYASWVFWIFALIQKSESVASPFNPFELAVRPWAVWDIMKGINEVGVWTIGGHIGSNSKGREPVSGLFLWLVWIAEAVVVVWVSVQVAIKMATSLPYCETCRRWCPKGKRLFSTPQDDWTKLRQRLEAKDFAYLISLGPGQPLPSKWFEVYLYSCDNCQSLHALTVNAASLEINKKGEQKKKETAVVDKLLLSPKELQMLTALLDQYNARAAAPPAAAAPPVPEATDESSESVGERDDQ